jgi:HEAT repeat protein
MGSLVVVVVGGLVAWAAVRLAMQREEARLRSWRKAAAETGLESVEEHERFLGRELTGRAGPLTVRFQRFKRGKGPSGTRIEILGLGHGDFGLSFRREGLGTRLDRVLTGESDIETGDAAFDREVFVSGRPALAHAVLGAEARRAAQALTSGRLPVPGAPWVEARVDVSGGKITVEITESVFDAPDRPQVSGALLRWLLDSARLLCAPASVPAAIAALAREDPAPGVRLACLRQLLEAFATDPATRPALLAARVDPDVAVRVEAALALGEDGVETLLDAARMEGTADGLRAKAIAGLGEGLPLELARATLGRAGDDAHRASALACVEALGRMGDRAVPVVTSALTSSDGEVAAAAARALGRTATTSEAALLAALADDRPAVRVAAAESLGRVGSVGSVPALRDAAERSDEGGLRRAVRQAIASIQARLSGAAPGQLSLAGGEAGQLSLADQRAPGGQVSLVEETAASPPSAAEERSPAAAPIADAEEEPGSRRPQRPGTIQGKT